MRGRDPKVVGLGIAIIIAFPITALILFNTGLFSKDQYPALSELQFVSGTIESVDVKGEDSRADNPLDKWLEVRLVEMERAFIIKTPIVSDLTFYEVQDSLNKKASSGGVVDIWVESKNIVQLSIDGQTIISYDYLLDYRIGQKAVSALLPVGFIFLFGAVIVLSRSKKRVKQTT